MPISIRLSKRLLLTSDKRQFILKEVKKAKETKRNTDGEILYRKGDELYYPIAFYPDIKTCLKMIPDRVLMRSNVRTLSRAVKIYSDATEKLLEIKKGE